MARYNVQKRATLDRLTIKHVLLTRKMLKDDLNKQVSDIFQSLNAGQRQYAPPTTGLSTKVEKKLVDHAGNTIKVGVSDGIQEITPGDDPELGLWGNFPDYYAIEDTLSVSLASERDSIFKQLLSPILDARDQFLRLNISTLTDEHLKNTKESYLGLASDWLAGESTIKEVQMALGVSLAKTDAESRRIFRTETTGYFNETRHSYFTQATTATHMQLFAVTDGRISDICETRHNYVMPIEVSGLKKNMPPFHPHCRTIQRPLISSLKRHANIIEKFKNSPSPSGFAPLPKGWA